MNLNTKVTPWLSFETQAREAAEFYVSIIPDSRIVQATKNPNSDSVVFVEFNLGGLPVYSLNVGQNWKFTNSFSLSVACDTQEEIDQTWESLSDGGKEIQCGWLTDRFGLAWQIVPANMQDYWNSPDRAKTERMMQAMMGMVKLNIAELDAAFHG